MRQRKTISRRRVVAGAAAAGVLVATGGVFAARQQTTPEYLYHSVIVPVVAQLRLAQHGMEPLLLGTALVESDLRFTRQEPAGPARGLYQMEPATHDAVLAKLKWFSEDDYRSVVGFLPPGVEPSAEALSTNAPYATALAAVLYEAAHRYRKALPERCDVVGQAAYWKRFWNTPKGKGTPARYLKAWAGAEAASVVGCPPPA